FDEGEHRGSPSAIERHRDDHEIAIFQFVVDRLPHWQVKAASSPACPRKQKNLAAPVVRKRVQVPVDIGESEIGSLERSEGLAPAIRGLAEKPERMRVVVNYRLVELACQGR